MTRQELDKYIQQNISEQGTMSASALSELIKELIGYMPYTVYVSTDKTTDFLHSPGYSIKSSQDEINSIIDSIARSINYRDASTMDSHAINVYAYDTLKREGLAFNSYVSIDWDTVDYTIRSITLKTSVCDLNYKLILTNGGLSYLTSE